MAVSQIFNVTIFDKLLAKFCAFKNYIWILLGFRLYGHHFDLELPSRGPDMDIDLPSHGQDLD